MNFFKLVTNSARQTKRSPCAVDFLGRSRVFAQSSTGFCSRLFHFRGPVPKRRVARSGRLPLRPPPQSDEMLGISQVRKGISTNTRGNEPTIDSTRNRVFRRKYTIVFYSQPLAVRFSLRLRSLVDCGPPREFEFPRA